MASVLAMNEGWTEADVPKFKGAYLSLHDVAEADAVVNGQFKPLRDSVNAGESA